MLKSIPTALLARMIARMLTPAIKKKGELMSSFWQAGPPQ
jgi:hypothetical protein